MSQTITVKIGGMSCDHCAKTVREALEQLPYVVEVEVNRKKEWAVIQASAELDYALISQAVDEVGYEALGII